MIDVILDLPHQGVVPHKEFSQSNFDGEHHGYGRADSLD
jgi:hypothetical protein